jgi:hypothetical protein
MTRFRSFRGTFSSLHLIGGFPRPILQTCTTRPPHSALYASRAGAIAGGFEAILIYRDVFDGVGRGLGGVDLDGVNPFFSRVSLLRHC